MPRLAHSGFVLLAALAAGAAQAQFFRSDPDAEARSAIRGSFMSCAAAGVLALEVKVGADLRRWLALPREIDRDRLYERLCDITSQRRLRARGEGERYELEAGDATLVMRYDQKAKQITEIEVRGTPPPVPAQKPASATPPAEKRAEPPPPPPPAAERTAEKAQPAPSPQPAVAVETPVTPAANTLPAPRRAQPLKPAGPCVVKPVMSDQDLANCGARR